MKKAFTLAEIMIALTVIGVITGILLPVANQSTPNEKVMKFKKGHATLYKVIGELVSSDKYYKDGDLGVKADGNLVDDSDDKNITYFCNTFADVISIKNTDCAKEGFGVEPYTQSGIFNGTTYNPSLDNPCKNAQTKAKEEVVTSDGIVFYQTNAKVPFGIKWANVLNMEGSCTPEFLSEHLEFAPACTNTENLLYKDHYSDIGTSRVYKIFCMDIDGINQGEAPFGYGIRVDGKILNGARAQQWLEKDLQDKE